MRNLSLFDLLIGLPVVITVSLIIIEKVRDYFYDDNDIIGY